MTMIHEVPHADKAILLIHGILGRPSQFSPFLDAIPKDYSVYNILLDGHGGNAREFAASNMKKWRMQIMNWVDKLIAQYSSVVIMGHSMGCLFAIQAAFRYPDRIKAVFLLAPALRIRLTWSAIFGNIKTAFHAAASSGPAERAKLDACGVTLPSNPLQYLTWLPRFTELLRESAATRSLARDLHIPVSVLLSAKDDLVSPKSADYFGINAKIRFLPQSTHYYYPESDIDTIRTELRKLCESVT